MNLCSLVGVVLLWRIDLPVEINNYVTIQVESKAA